MNYKVKQTSVRMELSPQVWLPSNWLMQEQLKYNKLMNSSINEKKNYIALISMNNVCYK